MEKRAVPVEELEFGMYVAALDRPWTDTPFMFQGFHLRTDQQLAALRKLCKQVYVDPEKSEPPEGRGAAPQFKIRGSAAYPEAVAVEAEFKPARQLYDRSVAELEDVLKPLGKPGGVLDAPAVVHA